MTPNNDKISNFQVGVFVFNTILGVGILTLPAALTKEVGSDAWLLSILAGLSNIPFIYFICKVGEKYSELGFLGTLKSLFGKFLGTVLSLPVLFYLIVNSGFVVRIFAETIKLYLLNNTPLEFIIMPLLILALFLVRSGVEPVGRFYEAITPIIIVIMIGLIVIAVPSPKQITNLRPYLTTPAIKYISGIKTGVFSFAGFEIVMVLYPFIKKPKGAFKASIISLMAIIVMYTVIVIECIAKFGDRETQALIYPTMTLIKSSEIPGAFIERMEGFLIAVWVLLVFTTLVSTMYGFSVIGGDLLKHKKRKHIIEIFLPVVYLAALTGDNVAQLFEMIGKLSLYIGGYTVMLLPTSMFLMALIKGKRNAGNRPDRGEKGEG